MESSSDGDYYQSILNLLIQDITTQPFTGDAAIAIFAMIGFLFCSALVSGAEVAFFSLSQKNINELQESDDTIAHRVLNLLERPRLLLATILIANNLFNISIIIISYYIINMLFTFSNMVLEFFVNAVLVTFIIVLFGEVIPKVYANYNNISFAKKISGPIMFLRKIFHPLGMVLVSSTRFIEKKMQSNGGNITLDEIDRAIDITVDESTTKEEISILKGIVKFGNINVKQVMCSRMDIVGIDVESNFSEVLEIVIDSGYSRIPVFNENIDNIEGILYTKDLLSYMEEKEDFRWQELLRTPFFVPEYKKIEDLLAEFRSKQTHMAVVVDEYGGTAGLVTLEDIMEEIIGEIKDEFDDAEEIKYQKIDSNNYIFEGKTLINDFSRIIGVKPDVFDPVKGEADTIAGLILEYVKRIPDHNEEISYQNFRFRILSVTKKRIQRVKVTIIEDEDFED